MAYCSVVCCVRISLPQLQPEREMEEERASNREIKKFRNDLQRWWRKRRENHMEIK